MKNYKMKIRILNFGITKDIIGHKTVELELPSDCTVGALKAFLIDKYPAFATLQSLQVAVNEEFADNEVLLSTQDEIALIPPVSGG
jgi:molybdopterin synthase sulfur carrier subunit